MRYEKRHLVLKCETPLGVYVKPRPSPSHINLTPPTASGVGTKPHPLPQAYVLSTAHCLGHRH